MSASAVFAVVGAAVVWAFAGAAPAENVPEGGGEREGEEERDDPDGGIHGGYAFGALPAGFGAGRRMR